MICMLVLNLNLKSVLLFRSSKLAGFLTLDSLVRHHLWIIQINAFPLQNWRDSLFEFSGGLPSQGHSAHFTPVVSEVSALHQSVLELVPHALVVICGLEA